MDIRQLTPRFYVSPQIDCSDIGALRDAGFTRILCNRPDGEVPPSHQVEAMRAAALAAGLRFEVQPLTHQTMIPDVIAKNRELGADTEDKVLAYCASGTRCCMAWALGVAGELEADEIVAVGAKAGYDLRGLRHLLDRPFV